MADARSFIDASDQLYDIVQISLLNSFAAAAGGLQGLAESSIYTLDAMHALLRRLVPGGVLAITRWVSVPPRDPLKLFATAAQAVRERGVNGPGGSLAWIRGWRTTTLLVKNGALTPEDIEAVRSFSRERGFDLAWLPGMRADESNRFNLLDRPWFYEGALALLGPDRDLFLHTYKFDVAPATDDRPYFSHTLKTSTLLELLRLPERAGFNLVEWGYPVLLTTLAQALVASIMLILLPLVALRREVQPELRSSTPAGAGGHLLRGARPCLPLRRDDLHPALSIVSRPSRVRRLSRALRVPGICRPRQRLGARIRAMARRRSPGRARRRRRDRHLGVG